MPIFVKIKTYLVTFGLLAGFPLSSFFVESSSKGSVESIAGHKNKDVNLKIINVLIFLYLYYD